MKVRAAIKKLCEGCYIAKRKNRLYVRCHKEKRHKQRQGFHTLASAEPTVQDLLGDVWTDVWRQARTFSWKWWR
ncbi:ribosomal protein L36-domain-containing protein [Pelagophyceae sp. CCMP2097]|nr:ribosomal protein L36-domain-containing protein [Pelagophyceae sp. CCMP2097]